MNTTATNVIATLAAIGTFESTWLSQRLVSGQKIVNEDLGDVEGFNITTDELLAMDYDAVREEIDYLKDALKHERAYILDVYEKAANLALSQVNKTNWGKLEKTATETQVTTAKPMNTKAQVIATIDATVEAAKDVRVLDIIENAILDYPHDTTMTDDLVFAIQEYLQDQSLKIQGGLRLLAASAKLEGVFSVAQKIKNSDAFQELVAENTPDELSAVSYKPSAKPEVVAVGTTASAVATPKPPKPAKTPKVAPKSKLPMPTIASISELESLDRKGLIEAVKAVKSNRPNVTLRANAATVELQKALAKEVLGMDYAAPAKASKATKAPKATKTKTQETISLPEGLSWDECKNMKYRDLQKVCKALRSQGLFSGNIGGKGATTANLLKGCADYFRAQGQDIVEVELKSQAPKADLHLPNWGAIVEQKRLERETTAALKLSNEDAKVALELAVAA